MISHRPEGDRTPGALKPAGGRRADDRARTRRRTDPRTTRNRGARWPSACSASTANRARADLNARGSGRPAAAAGRRDLGLVGYRASSLIVAGSEDRPSARIRD